MKRLYLLAALAVGLLLTATTAPAATKPAQPVDLQLLTISDWHAQLEPVSGVGGAASLASYFAAERAGNPNTLTFTAGDAYGASPPIASFFNEEPAVKALRMMGIDADTFGNHNWDKGNAHLQQMIDLASAPAGTQPGKPFRYLSANLKNLDENLTGVDKWGWFRVGGLKIAVIGATNEEAPTLVRPDALGTIEITDAAAAVNKWAEATRRAGADVVVVLTHKGLRGFDSTGQPFGELIDLANAVEGVDVIVGDHTDVQYTGVVNGVRVVEARSKGLSYARTNLTVTSGAGVTATSTQFVVPTVSAVTPDPAIQGMISDLQTQLQPILGTVIGESTVRVPRSDSCGRADGRLCESRVGNATTDAMRLTYGTDFAVTNSGGLRADLTCSGTSAGSGFCPLFTPPNWLITRGQVLGVLPFGNVVATLSVSGVELKQYLENGVSAMPGANGKFAQVSGLCFTYDIAATAGSRVTSVVRQAADGTCTVTPVDLSVVSNYSLAINDFMASGGDGYPNLFSRITTRGIMDAVVADQVAANSPIGPSIQGRIVCADSNGTLTAPNCPAVTAP